MTIPSTLNSNLSSSFDKNLYDAYTTPLNLIKDSQSDDLLQDMSEPFLGMKENTLALSAGSFKNLLQTNENPVTPLPYLIIADEYLPEYDESS
jgi:hypothetical protein